MGTDEAAIEEVAEAIRRAGSDRDRMRETMTGLYAEMVEIAHQPPQPSDGPVPAGVLIAMADREVGALSRAISEPWTDPPEVTVDGECIRVRNRMGGTLADGTDVELATNTLYTIRAGRIVGLRSEMAPEETQRWSSMLVAGSFEAPSEWSR